MSRLLKTLATGGALFLLIAVGALALVSQPRPVGALPAATDEGQDPPASIAPVGVIPSAVPGCTNGGSAYLTGDGPNLTVRVAARAAAAAVIAKVTAVGAPVWNTPPGQSPDVSTAWPAGLVIYTPLTIVVNDVAKGSVSGVTVVRALGGLIGCNRFVAVGHSIPSVGETVALFLTPVSTSSGGRDGQSLAVMAAWSVDASGTVATPFDGPLPVQTFLSQVAAASSGP